MTSLKLSLAPPALVRLHDTLICLAKFSDSVAIEAEHDQVRALPNDLSLKIKELITNLRYKAQAKCSQLN